MTDYRSITMTCTANDCNHRSTHEFTKKSYQKGIVIIQCPSCKERYVPIFHVCGKSGADDRHLIADNLGWFNVCHSGHKSSIRRDRKKSKADKIGKYGRRETTEC